MKNLKNLKKFISTRVAILSLLAVIIYLTYYRREKLEGDTEAATAAAMGTAVTGTLTAQDQGSGQGLSTGVYTPPAATGTAAGSQAQTQALPAQKRAPKMKWRLCKE